MQKAGRASTLTPTRDGAINGLGSYPGQQEAAAQHPSVEMKKGKKVKKHVGVKSPSRTQSAAAEEGDQGERPRARSEFEMSNPMAASQTAGSRTKSTSHLD